MKTIPCRTAADTVKSGDPAAEQRGRQYRANGGHTQPQERRENKPRFDQRQERAENAARQLLYSWSEHGRHAANDLPPDRFPNITLRTIAETLAPATEGKVIGWPDALPLFSEEHIRAGFLECAEGVFPPSPEHCRPLVENLNAFHVEMRQREIAAKLNQAIDRGEEITELLHKLRALDAEAAVVTGNPFTFTRAGEIQGIAEAADFVEGILTEGGASVVYGPSNCGKSFWTLDLAAAVATGRPFRDELDTEQGAVVYVALEGSHGMRNRIAALRQAGKLSDDAPLFLCFDSVSLLEPGHAARLAETARQAAAKSDMPCRLVILDTLARAMAGGDENKGEDMGTAVAAIDAVKAATGAHVLTVHHCGKDEARGARGHSSLRGAVDTEIEVSRPDSETVSTVRITKQRDLSPCGPLPFSLVSVTLGTDRRGKPVTSCTVRHEDEMMAASPAKAGRKAKCTPAEMLAFLPAENVKEWLRRVKDETGLGESQFYEIKRQLEVSKSFRREVATGRIVCS